MQSPAGDVASNMDCLCPCTEHNHKQCKNSSALQYRFMFAQGTKLISDKGPDPALEGAF